MTKQVEFIPFMGIVEFDDSIKVDKTLTNKTQQEVADELGMAKSTITDIEQRALRKFKTALEAKFKKDDFI